jgi:hypothetical protein
MTEQNILSELLSFTEAGEHTKFQLLQSWREYLFTRKVRYSLKILTNSLQASADKLFKSYCSGVAAGASDVHELLAYSQVIKIYRFYLEELKIIDDMLNEYESYLIAGNWLDFIFNTQRPVDKLWDHRGE